ncbi:MAG: 3-hydroxyacyl-CoA dehydrogenase family protein [Proteobacteria bacterium]|nr:3-hydroxyacyl-CoA dehydrogenase family protein [Pseudomonadota bacterium]
MTDRIKKLAMIGGGTMGAQISTHAAASGYRVSLYDTNKDAFKMSFEIFKFMIGMFDRKPVKTVEELERVAGQVEVVDDLAKALEDADLVIEAIPEDLGLKRKMFREIDALAPAKAILASNSSSIPISRIEDATSRPEQCLNTHFYIPSVILNMVDIMGGTRTRPDVVAAAKDWVWSIGSVPLTVNKEILGFCFNRVWRAVKRETLYMWAEGFVDFRDIDRAWMIFTGNPRGPFGMMDAVGLDVVYGIEMVYYNESKDPKDHPPDRLKDMIDRGELGLKTGKGFYGYPDPEYGRPDFIKR